MVTEEELVGVGVDKENVMIRFKLKLNYDNKMKN